jgi:hypothetical protein
MNSGKILDSEEVRFLMDTKDRSNLPMATAEQMAEVKKKIDKYKITNGVGNTKEEKPVVVNNLRHKNGMTTWELMKATATGRERAEMKRIERKNEAAMNKSNRYGLTKEAYRYVKDETAPSSMDQYYKNKKPFIKKPGGTTVATVTATAQQKAHQANSIKEPEQKKVVEPEIDVEQLVKERAAKKLEQEEAAAKKAGGLVYQLWKNPII